MINTAEDSRVGDYSGPVLHASTLELSMISGALYQRVATYSVRKPVWSCSGSAIRARPKSQIWRSGEELEGSLCWRTSKGQILVRFWPEHGCMWLETFELMNKPALVKGNQRTMTYVLTFNWSCRKHLCFAFQSVR